MTIEAYMQLLTNDLSARAEFRQDPEGAMTRCGLSADDRAIVATRDPAQIRAAVARTDPAGAQQLKITF